MKVELKTDMWEDMENMFSKSRLTSQVIGMGAFLSFYFGLYKLGMVALGGQLIILFLTEMSYNKWKQTHGK